MSDIIYGEYVSKFRELRVAVEANDRLALHNELENAARGGLRLAVAISEIAVWDAARRSVPRSHEELLSAISTLHAL